MLIKYIWLFEEFNSELNLPFFHEFFYHGTNQNFDKFDTSYIGSNFNTSILGIYFT